MLCETIEREISTPVLFDTKEQARAEMVKQFKEAINLTDEEFETIMATHCCTFHTAGHLITSDLSTTHPKKC